MMPEKKPKPGRPRKPESQKSNTNLLIRLRAVDKAKLFANAAKADTTATEFIRVKCCGD